MNMSELHVVFIHGNGGGTSVDYWFPQVKNVLEELGITYVARDFPDNQVAHESIWIPFLKNEIGCNEHTVIIGHSSGAVAAMRYAESNIIYGSVLVGCNYTDLGDDTEKESGYYSRPWNWNAIKSNQHWILQFASTDDPYIPISEPRFIHQPLDSEYYEYSDKGHFMIFEFPELIKILRKKFIF